MLRDAEQIVRFWQAVEIFSPQPLQGPNIRDNVTDVRPGEPMPWEPGSRVAERPPATGKVWLHQVFGGLFELSQVRDALLIVHGGDQAGGELPGQPARGQSALFACTVGADGVLAGEPAVSPCARAIGHIAAGDAEAVAALDGPEGGSPAAGDLSGRPLSGDDLRDFAVTLAERLGVATLLEPRGLRVRSYQVPAGSPAGDDPPGRLLGSPFDDDLTQIAGAIRAGNGGALLAAFLSGSAQDDPDGEGSKCGKIDVRREPLVVRDSCAPGRIPPGRWPADGPLARSEQFAVNEIIRCPGLFAVHAPPGTGTVPVFSDLVAAIVVERARHLADLPSPGAAFGRPRAWGSHSVSAPAAALTGFEIILAAPEGDTGLADIGTHWRDRAAEADYFPSTGRLADSDGTWALITARLGDRADRRAFVERFWQGTVRGTDVLFRAGESMPAALRRLKNEVVDWPAAVGRFRTALAGVCELSSERTVAAAALTRLSVLEQACEEASSALEAARQRCADLAEREPRLRENLVAAEERRRARIADLEARGQQRAATEAGGTDLDADAGKQCATEAAGADLAANGRERPALASEPARTADGGRERPSVAGALAGRLRAGRQWVTERGAHRALRAACAAATQQRDSALREEQTLRADLASARRDAAAAESAVAALTAEMARLQEPVTRARQRWGDQVPDGPSQAETEDAALIERREKSPAWADEEYTAARAELFLAALTLHKALIAAQAETFERNLGALMDLLSGGGQPPPEVALAAWQSFFLVVPVVRVTFEAAGSLFGGLGRGSAGWLLAASAGRLAPAQVLGGLWRASHAVLAGDSPRDQPAVMLPWAGQQALAKAVGAAEEQSPGHTSAQQLADRAARYGTWVPDGAGDGLTWVGAPLRVVRGDVPAGGHERDDGLVVFAVTQTAPVPSARRLALSAYSVLDALAVKLRFEQVHGLGERFLLGGGECTQDPGQWPGSAN